MKNSCGRTVTKRKESCIAKRKTVETSKNKEAVSYGKIYNSYGYLARLEDKDIDNAVYTLGKIKAR